MNDWMDILLSGALEFAVPNLVLIRGDAHRFSGDGRVAWASRSKVRISAVTDGGASLLSRLIPQWEPGILIPPEDFLHVEGKCLGDWHLQSQPVPLQGFSLHAGSPQVIWDLRISALTLKRSAKVRPAHRVIRALVGPSPGSWTRGTVTEIRNEEFGYLSDCSDWLKCSLHFGTLAARQRSKEWFEVRLILNMAPSETDAPKLVGAVASAFGFATGRRLILRGYEDITQDYEQRCLVAGPEDVKQTELPQPLGAGEAYLQGVEQLLPKATEFFLTDRGRQAAAYLHLLWDTADNDINTRLAVASTSLEGLLGLVSTQGAVKDQTLNEADIPRLQKYIKENAKLLTPRFVERVEGFLGSMTHRRPVDTLRDWETRRILGIDHDDVEAWRLGRNPSAHGNVVTSDAGRQEKQALYSRLLRIMNIFNRVALQLVGYRGNYRDYAKPRWPEVQFPGSDDDRL